MKRETTSTQTREYTDTITRALRRAGKAARKTALAYGTPIYVMRDGKIVAVKPTKP